MLWIMGFLSMMERHVILLAPLLVLVSVILTHGGTVSASTQRLARKMTNSFHIFCSLSMKDSSVGDVILKVYIVQHKTDVYKVSAFQWGILCRY